MFSKFKAKNITLKKNFSKFKEILKKRVVLLSIIFFTLCVLGYGAYLLKIFSQIQINKFSTEDSDFNFEDKRRPNIAFIGGDVHENGYIFVDFVALVEYDQDTDEIKIINIDPLFAAYYKNDSENRTIKNSLAQAQSDSNTISMKSLLLDIATISGMRVDGYIYVSRADFDKFFSDNKFGKLEISAPSELRDDDIDGDFKIEKNNKVKMSDFTKFVSADDAGQDDKMERQLSAMQSLFGNLSYYNLLYTLPIHSNELTSIVKSNLNKYDMLRLFYQLRFQDEEKIRVGYIKFNPGYLRTTTFGEIWRPVYENVNFDMNLILTRNEVKIEQATMDVLNCTSRDGLAGVRTRWLRNRGIRITFSGSCNEKLSKNKLYVADPKKYPNTIDEIIKTLNGEVEIIVGVYPQRSVGDIVLLIGDDEVLK